MEYQKYNLRSYNLHLLKTDKFKTVSILVNFNRFINKDEVTIRNFLPSVLLQSTKKYPTKRLLNIECEKLYGLEIYINRQRIGNYSSISFNMEMLNEKYTEEGLYEKALDFLFEILFNPHVKNGCFEKKEFDIQKKIYTAKLKSLKDDTRMYSILRMLEELDDKSPLSYRVGYLDDLEKIDMKNLYEYYLNMLNSDMVDIYVLGEFDFNDMKTMIKEKFAINTIKHGCKNIYIKHNNYRRILKKVDEKNEINQAKLSIGCKILNLTDFEAKYVMPIYTSILGGSGYSKLFKNVRERHSLAYYIGCSYRNADNLLIIYSGINKADYPKTLQLIKKEMSDMVKGNITDEELTNAQKDLISIIRDIEDLPDRLINSRYLTDFLGLDALEVREANYLKVTKEDLKKVAKKIKLDTSFLLFGDDKDEKNTD